MNDFPESLTETCPVKSIDDGSALAEVGLTSVNPVLVADAAAGAFAPQGSASEQIGLAGKQVSSKVSAPSRKKYATLIAGLGLVAIVAAAHWKKVNRAIPDTLVPQAILTKERLAKMLADSASFYHFPTEIEIPGVKGKAVIQYAFDPKLQEEMENLFRQYRPDYGAFVALDAETGQVLSIVSYTTNPQVKDNLALRSTFPSASVFKVVTAAAAIESQKFSAETVIPFNGANHTLYRGNILKTKETRWTRRISLKEAFAKSINTVFGRIGAYNVGAEELKVYADRFGFNRPIPADFPVQPGKAPIPYDTWGLAETASGYTRENQMSPIQGALIAASIVNNGKMMEPYFVQQVYNQEGAEIYKAQPKVATLSVDPATAAEIRRLMQETVARGTSQKTFRGFARSKYRDIDVGGKTGSLTGTEPKGKYDWFVGFAEGRNHKLAFAALTIHEKLWRVKSSYLVRRGIESYFSRIAKPADQADDSEE